jgi:formyltetrahydrofolate-dependent phosphoribosylglycinamide formyltransferase
MKRIAVLISGAGSNLKNLAEKVAKDLKTKCQISLVVSNVANVKGLEIAEEFKIKSIVLEDVSKKINIVSGNVGNYNDFIKLKSNSEKAFEPLNEILKEHNFQYSLETLIADCLNNINTLSNFPEEDIKETILSDVFFEAFTEKYSEISEKQQEELQIQIDDILYGLIEEIKIISRLFEIIKKHPEFMNFFARERYDEALHAILLESKIDYIFLAGFMRILSPSFVSKWENKILNIHPSLLPSFGGAKAVHEAFNYGVKITGSTVHFVNSGVDNGKILLQKAVEVLPSDTVESLHERIKLTEKELYPQALENLINGKI